MLDDLLLIHYPYMGPDDVTKTEVLKTIELVCEKGSIIGKTNVDGRLQFRSNFQTFSGNCGGGAVLLNTMTIVGIHREIEHEDLPSKKRKLTKELLEEARSSQKASFSIIISALDIMTLF